MSHFIFQGFIYRESEVILNEYFLFLARCKLIHSKVPSTDPTEIEDYLSTLNSSMGFTGKNLITRSDLDPNPMKKEHIKGMMNQGMNVLLKIPTSMKIFYCFRSGEANAEK